MSYVNIKEVIKDIQFLKDKAENPFAKIAYGMAIVVCEAHGMSLREQADPKCPICRGSGQDTTITAFTATCACIDRIRLKQLKSL